MEVAIEKNDRAALMAALADEVLVNKLCAKMCFLARSRYGMLPQDGEEVFHEAVLTYLLVGERYPATDNHFGLLVGIFHKKAFESMKKSGRRESMAQKLLNRLRGECPDKANGQDPQGSAADIVVRSEQACLIRRAIKSFDCEELRWLLLMAEGHKTRLQLIEELGINRNTFDTRIRDTRLRLRQLLQESGVAA